MSSGSSMILKGQKHREIHLVSRWRMHAAVYVFLWAKADIASVSGVAVGSQELTCLSRLEVESLVCAHVMEWDG